MSTNLPYKLFLPQSTPSMHRVFAIYQDQGWDELKAVATFDDRASAVRLADALNELLAGADLAPDFVAEALETAPRPVRAQVERIARKIESEVAAEASPTDYLDALSRPSICGVMRFPLAPADPDDSIITPRTAETLRYHGEIYVEELNALIAGDAEVFRHELPTALQRQKLPFLKQFATCFDHLLECLDSGTWPEPRSMGEEIALWIMLERATEQIEEERAGFEAFTSPSLNDLPKSEFDYNFDDLTESLFHDHEFRYSVLDQPTPFENGALKHLFKPFSYQEPQKLTLRKRG
ncbi:hypothetical protein [Nocardia sp. XZ_19_385]|uniref:hypothetical protein n=1 Tax=Nocardia sp. XZ_19_385 TaxID=2769488 RepID=UPI00188F89A4|nr:hypothetical protein [Nocardia sp. XZ_19_385]